MDLIQIRTFIAVAEEEHLTRGAERIHLSLSAASAHVRAIEDAYGVRLFNRTNRALELTHAGRCLLQRAKDLLRQVAEFESEARLLAGEVAGTITFGCNANPWLSKAGEIVHAVREQQPGVEIKILRRTSLAAQQGLQSGELDVAMFIGHPADAEIVYHTIQTVVYRIAGPTKWADVIASGDWSKLAALPSIGIVSNPLFTQMLDLPFDELGLTRRVVVQTDSDLFLRSMISAGVGLSIIREDHALEGQSAGAMIMANHWKAKGELRLAYLRRRAHDPLIQAFIAGVKSIWADLDIK